MSTLVLGPPAPFPQSLAEGLRAPLANIGGLQIPQDTTGVVIVVGADSALGPTTVGHISVHNWHELAEAPMKRTLEALQDCWETMSGRGGRIVLVTPTIGMSGGPHLVPYTTGVEGTRAMAKSAARQWAPAGIVINTITAPLHLFAPGMAGSAGHLTAAAVPDDASHKSTLTDSVVATARFLLETDAPHLVGATIVVDGGAVMLP